MPGPTLINDTQGSLHARGLVIYKLGSHHFGRSPLWPQCWVTHALRKGKAGRLRINAGCFRSRKQVFSIELRFPFPPVEVLAEGTSFDLVLYCGGWLNLLRVSLKHCPPRHWGWPHGHFLVLSLELPDSVTDMACLKGYWGPPCQPQWPQAHAQPGE
jgi:hypothetical protein